MSTRTKCTHWRTSFAMLTHASARAETTCAQSVKSAFSTPPTQFTTVRARFRAITRRLSAQSGWTCSVSAHRSCWGLKREGALRSRRYTPHVAAQTTCPSTRISRAEAAGGGRRYSSQRSPSCGFTRRAGGEEVHVRLVWHCEAL
jgi:hypothetical protein